MNHLTDIDELLQDEQVKWIVGFEGDYAITDLGRVFSFKSGLNEAVELQGSVMNTGYRRINPRRNGKSIWTDVHVAVLEAFVGPRPEGCVCRHLNGDKLDNRLENLRWGSRSENNLDAVRHGTHNMGEKHHFTTMTEDDVIEMRRLRRDTNLTYREIGERYDVGTKSAWRIINRKTWKHVKEKQ